MTLYEYIKKVDGDDITDKVVDMEVYLYIPEDVEDSYDRFINKLAKMTECDGSVANFYDVFIKRVDLIKDLFYGVEEDYETANDEAIVVDFIWGTLWKLIAGYTDEDTYEELYKGLCKEA